MCLFTNAATLSLLLLTQVEFAQNSTTGLDQQKSDVAVKSDPTTAETEKADSSRKYRLLQSNALLVETAYHQDEGELQHSFSFARGNRGNWSFNFTEEIPLGGEKHQLSFSLPAQMVRDGADGIRGFGDTKFEYSYFLYGSNSSRITIAPGFGLTIPTGNSRKELGAGASGVSFKIPVSVMLSKRCASNSTFETTFTKSARNHEGERAYVTDFEIGQSIVWFAKPNLNFLIEAVWERNQEVIGDGLRKASRNFSSVRASVGLIPSKMV